MQLRSLQHQASTDTKSLPDGLAFICERSVAEPCITRIQTLQRVVNIDEEYADF